MYRLYLSDEPACEIGWVGLYQSMFLVIFVSLMDSIRGSLSGLYESEFPTMYGAPILCKSTGQSMVGFDSKHSLFCL